MAALTTAATMIDRCDRCNMFMLNTMTHFYSSHLCHQLSLAGNRFVSNKVRSVLNAHVQLCVYYNDVLLKTVYSMCLNVMLYPQHEERGTFFLETLVND